MINYSAEPYPGAQLSIQPHGLLHETTIHPQEINIHHWNKLPIFFQTAGEPIPFDLFSAAFYLLSRYEEYLPFTADEHGRYPAMESLAFRQHFLDIALVDRWIMQLAIVIRSIEPAFHFPQKTMSFIPTYDIDIAYSYRGKGLRRNLGGLLLDAFTGRFDRIGQRIAVLAGSQTDPYDSYAFLDDLHGHYALKPIYFFLLGENSTYDKNLNAGHRLMRDLIRNISDRHWVGIHPSYHSKDDPSKMEKEIGQLKTGLSRQHYIRFTLPDTYRMLINLGITEEYSMGYGSMNGFRASTSYPHLWFDLQRNETTALRVYPFCYMECNSFYEQHMNTHQALIEILHYVTEVRYCKGTLITIWHNFSLGTDPLWEGWRHVYEKQIEYLHHHNSSTTA